MVGYFLLLACLSKRTILTFFSLITAEAGGCIGNSYAKNNGVNNGSLSWLCAATLTLIPATWEPCIPLTTPASPEAARTPGCLLPLTSPSSEYLASSVAHRGSLQTVYTFLPHLPHNAFSALVQRVFPAATWPCGWIWQSLVSGPGPLPGSHWQQLRGPLSQRSLGLP
jgi:hypothetical protein